MRYNNCNCAGGQETQIVGGVARFQNAAGNGDRRGKAGGVLIDVEGIVEMRDSGPFNVLQFVNHGALVILLVEPTVQGVERLRGERRAGHIHIVRLALKFGKECLTVEATSPTMIR